MHYNNQVEALADLVRARHPHVDVACCESYDELPAALARFAPEVLFSIKFEGRPYPRDPVLATRSLKWIAVGGVGVDHIAPWDPTRLTVTNGAGIASDVMAFYVVGAIIALTMRFPKFMRQQIAHHWAWDYVGVVAGRRVCIIGLGHIGQAVARLAACLGLDVVGVRTRPVPTEHVTQVYGVHDLHVAVSDSDYIVVAVPLVAETRHLIDAAAIGAAKEGAFLIDVSRGGVTDPEALLDAITSGKLGGAMLDVFEDEPMRRDSPFWDMENVIITPHTSGIYQGWERRAVEIFCDNLERFRTGQMLENIVDSTRGY